MASTLPRSILFFSTLFTDMNGTPLPDQSRPWQELEKLPYLRTSGKCRAQNVENDHVAGKIISISGARVFGDFGKTRYSDFPVKKNKDEDRSELDLGDDEGLEHKSHFTWWQLTNLPLMTSSSKQNPMGCLVWEHNQQAPRATSLQAYLQVLFHKKYIIEIHPIVNTKAWSRLKKHNHLGKIFVRLGRSEDDDSDGGGVLSSLWTPAPKNCAEVEVTFKPEPRQTYSKKDVLARLKKWKEIPEVERLSVAIGKGIILDLLSPHLKSQTTVAKMKGRSRAVDPDDIGRKLDNVFVAEGSNLARFFGRRWDAQVLELDDASSPDDGEDASADEAEEADE